jgi:hypothetical protein
MRDVWRARVRSSLFWCKLWGGFLLLVLAAEVARRGTLTARVLAFVALGGVAVGLLVFGVRERRAWQAPRTIIRRVLVPTDSDLGARTLRAQVLWERAGEHPGESAELAQAHLGRLVGRASVDAVRATAAKRAKRFRWIWVACALGTIGFVLGAPLRVVEGLNVLLARGGVAPLELAYLEDPSVTAELPAYLRGASRALSLDFGIPVLPEGSVITVRSKARVGGRQLVVTDGVTDVPLVSDGQGGLVAHWTVTDPTELRVAAQFGEVKVFDPLRRSVASTEDREPLVLLEGAPGVVELIELERLDLRFVASDDYGLEQVDLVLRSGRREERRQLAKLDGEERLYRSGHALLPNDAFLRRMFLPVFVTIEAKDNRPTGPVRWGKSPAIEIRPPPVGRPEAQRYEALRALRDGLVDVVALDQAGAKPEHRAEALASLKKVFESAVTERPGGLDVPTGVRSFVAAQLEALGRTDAARDRRPSDAVLLAVDVLLSRLSSDGARRVAPRLADVVEEVAVRTHALREQSERDLKGVRSVLDYAHAGATELSRLGLLGRDLGGVATGDLGRVKRSLDAGDLRHAELAALHLAARLRRPNPSFGSAGGGGVESGMPMGGQGAGNASPSEAPGDFDQMAGELEELAADHAQQMSELDRLLNEAQAAAAEPRQARERADALREALASLPEVGGMPGSASSAAARGRGHGESMADNLEAGDLGRAAESGRAALEALEEAERMRAAGQGWLDAEDLKRAADAVRRELEATQRENALERERQKGQLRDQLGERAEREERLGQRAQELAGKGRDADAPLPSEAVRGLEEAARLMREAAREMREGNAERSLALQQKAQESLERSRTGRTPDPNASEGEDGEGDAEGTEGEMAREGDVPGARDRDATQEFRERLQRGLGRPSGRLAPAVRRYAEALE